jgi:nickel transport system ATP-binding protein
MLLQVKDIRKSYGKKEVLKGIDFSMKAGECLGIIGESGSGKSTLGKIILGIEKKDQGEVVFLEETALKLHQKEMSVVFQDYTSSVNPRFTVSKALEEALLKEKLTKKEMFERQIQLLQEVGLSEMFLNRYPHELSGGQLQRVCIARAIATKPKLILLDEAISSLDVSMQVGILDLLKKLREEHGLSYLFITHDLTAITYLCDRVLFMKEGEIVERVEDMKEIKAIQNPYAKALLHAAHVLDFSKRADERENDLDRRLDA